MLPSPLNSWFWEAAKWELKKHIPETAFRMWIEPVVFIAATRDTMTIGVPNDFHAIRVHDAYLARIRQQVSARAGRVVSIALQKLPPDFRRSVSLPRWD